MGGDARRHRIILESLAEGVVLQAADGRVVGCNPAAERLLGLPRGELEGRSAADFRWRVTREDGTPWPLETHPAMLTLATGAPITDEVMGVQRPDGSQLWLSVSSRLLPSDGRSEARVVTSFADITATRRSEEARRTSDERFRRVFEEAPIGMAMVDLDGYLVMVNDAMASITGYARRDLSGIRFADLFASDETGSTSPLDEVLRVPSHRSERRCRHAAGHTVWVAVQATVVRGATGAPVYSICQLQDITDRRNHEDRLQHLADHDALTGLLNRRAFMTRLDHHVSQIARYGAEGALLVLDLDNFKSVNDSFGHAAGDELVTNVASILRTRLRESDIIARLGGDEFAILLPKADATGAALVAEKLLEAVRTGTDSGEQRRAVTTSVGVALFDGLSLTGEDALVNADLAMYDAKEAGRNRMAVFSRSLQDTPRIKTRITWAERIEHALDTGGFVLHAQPIVEIATGAVVKHELLVRMLAHDGSLIPPGAFLPVAEQFDLVQGIDRWVVARGIEMIAKLAALGRREVLAINLSGRSLTDPNLVRRVEAEIAAARIDASTLVFEITETAAVSNIPLARTITDGLRSLGCRVALDDFGAGFGSFYYLKHLPVDLLKIDGEFVNHCVENRTDQIVIEALVALAQGMGMQTIAEFTRDAPTFELLGELGVDMAQGFHIGMPVLATDAFGLSLTGLER